MWTISNSMLPTIQVPRLHCRLWRSRQRWRWQGWSRRGARPRQRTRWLWPSNWSSLSRISAYTPTFFVICRVYFPAILTRCRGGWRHFSLARERRLHSPSGKLPEVPQLRREDTNASEDACSPKEFGPGQGCWIEVFPRKLLLTSWDFQQTVSWKCWFHLNVAGRILGLERGKMFGLKELSRLLSKPCWTSSHWSHSTSSVNTRKTNDKPKGKAKVIYTPTTYSALFIDLHSYRKLRVHT